MREHWNSTVERKKCGEKQIFNNGIVGETEHSSTDYMALWQGDGRYPLGGVGERGRVPVSPSSVEFVTSKICGLNRLRLPASPLPFPPVAASRDILHHPKSAKPKKLQRIFAY